MKSTAGKTKILATLGPASWSTDQIRALIRAGADAFRVNFSHGDGRTLGPVLERVREAADAEGAPIPVLADIQGPKLRIGDLPEDGVLLHEGERFTLTSRQVRGSEQIVHTPHKEIPEHLTTGDRIYLADGTIKLEVEKVKDGDVHTRVTTGGHLFSHKGINLPGIDLPFLDTITGKDERDLSFIAGAGFDMVAVSFVRRGRDLERARQIMGAVKIPVMAKVERPEAIQNIEDILAASDGILIARGDLGVELPLEQVPILQKELLQRAARAGKWAVVATQMLASMVSSPRPTRAEATDVVNAILDGADTIMLSEETAAGHYPAKAVETMANLARTVETSTACEIFRPKIEIEGFAGGAAGAAVSASERLGAKAIVTLAGSGTTALLVSKQRPRLPILALSADPGALRRLNALWGVHPVQIPHKAEFEEQIREADQYLIGNQWAREGETVVVVAALPLGEGREPNTIFFHDVGGPV